MYPVGYELQGYRAIEGLILTMFDVSTPGMIFPLLRSVNFDNFVIKIHIH